VITASFAYDAFSRRIGRTDANGVTTTYLYDGNDAVQEAGDGTTRSILTGANIDERFARDDASGRTYFLRDALGSTIALTDATANILQRYDYEPYGEVKAAGTAGLSNPYQYTGRENDGNGLYYYRARYYNPATKRFISEDPIGLRGGPNSYAYVEGNPIGLIDLYGLAGETLDFGDGYTGRVDRFNYGDQASYEIHVFDAKGREAGVLGPDGWINKHGLTDPPALPDNVTNRLNGRNIDELRKIGQVKPKGLQNIKALRRLLKAAKIIPYLGACIIVGGAYTSDDPVGEILGGLTGSGDAN